VDEGTSLFVNIVSFILNIVHMRRKVSISFSGISIEIRDESRVSVSEGVYASNDANIRRRRLGWFGDFKNEHCIDSLSKPHNSEKRETTTTRVGGAQAECRVEEHLNG